MAVKKKTVKKPVRRKPTKTTVEASVPPLAYFKLTTGEELCGYVDDKIMSKAGIILCYHPMALTNYQEILIMVPYGPQAKDTEIYQFPMQQIVSIFEVSEEFSYFYALSRKANEKSTHDYFAQIIHNSVKIALKKIDRNNEKKEPTIEELDKIEKEVEKPERKFIATASVPDEGDTAESAVDLLVKLAEAAGKGKNVNK